MCLHSLISTDMGTQRRPSLFLTPIEIKPSCQSVSDEDVLVSWPGATLPIIQLSLELQWTK